MARASEIAGWCERLLEGALPSGDDIVADAERVSAIAELERLTSVACAEIVFARQLIEHAA